MRKFEYVKRVLGEDELASFDLPKRSTKNSAGYDFFNPEKIEIKPKEIVYAKTGVKASMFRNEVLILANRSSNPKKKGLILINGIGVIDADFYNNEDNEGEIAFAFYNITDETVVIDKNEKLGQGFFTEFLITENDTATAERVGGFGSTGV